MIHISTVNAFMIYLGATIGTLLLVWVIHHLRSRNAKLLLTEHQLFVCEYCQNVYLDEHTKEVTACPQCEAFNKNNAYQGEAVN